ncbi:flagellar basal body-associated FliL family protein [Gemmatimonas aurantiaca]|uniref:flagellar basal body-associated FliL family protein n=1 Tax=Gemmatimonas aurantiaca TaxID=173480 RepID=UPI00301C2E06
MSSEQPQAAEAAPSKPKLPLLIGMVAVGLAVGGGTGAAVLGPMAAKKMGKATPVVAADSAAEGEAGGEHGAPAEGGHGGEGAKGGGAAEVLLLENLVLNPAGSGGSRFLLLTVAIEAGKPPALEQFKARDAELRDIVLTALGTKTVDQLTDITQRDQFKSELQAAVDARFGKQSVKRLYFPQFVVQ